ncbi:unnamed protein product [Linum tenue]|uniref:Uncharacterized protein n=1 Tax=Linum tenue TaxID=586396 RepID=A0AAV0H805_9ROSI|nr:unnamed protein product [Linum tenue]
MEALECRECRVRDSPPPVDGISSSSKKMSDGYSDLPFWLDPERGYCKSLKNIVSGDKLFSLNIAERKVPEDDFVVGVMDVRWPVLEPMRIGRRDDLGFQHLEEVELCLNAKFKDIVHSTCVGGVLPLVVDDNSNNNWFCVFIWCPCLLTLALCKFRLVKNLSAAAAAVDSMESDESSSSSSTWENGGLYECHDLSDARFAIDDCYLEPRQLLTPVGTFRLPW